jgi:ubiquinone/menaquinone biosynthesis C-methylase UbiE
MARRNAFYSVSSAAEFEDAERIDHDAFWASGRQEVDSLLWTLDLQSLRDGSVVEIGCGLGRMTHRLGQLFKHVDAIDVSAEMVQRARSFWGHMDNVQFMVGNGMDLQPIPTASARLVLSYIVLQHVPTPEVVLGYIRESARVLEPGGLALLQFRTTGSASLRQLLTVAAPDLLLRRFRIWKKHWKVAQPASTGSATLEEEYGQHYVSWRGNAVCPSAVKRIAAEVGLKIERVTGVGTQYTYYTLRKRG